MSSKWETSWLTLGGTELLKNNPYTLIRRISSTYHTKAEFSSLSTTPALGHVNVRVICSFFPMTWSGAHLALSTFSKEPWYMQHRSEYNDSWLPRVRVSNWFSAHHLIIPPNAFSKKWLSLKSDPEAGGGRVGSTWSMILYLRNRVMKINCTSRRVWHLNKPKSIR